MGGLNKAIGWFIWILPLAFLYFLGKIDFQVKKTGPFLIIIIAISFFIVMSLSAINYRNDKLEN